MLIPILLFALALVFFLWKKPATGAFPLLAGTGYSFVLAPKETFTGCFIVGGILMGLFTLAPIIADVTDRIIKEWKK